MRSEQRRPYRQTPSRPESDDCASETGAPTTSRSNATHNPKITTRLKLIPHPPRCVLQAPGYTPSFGAHIVWPVGLSFSLLTGNLTLSRQPTKTVRKKFPYFVSHFGF